MQKTANNYQRRRNPGSKIGDAGGLAVVQVADSTARGSTCGFAIAGTGPTCPRLAGVAVQPTSGEIERHCGYRPLLGPIEGPLAGPVTLHDLSVGRAVNVGLWQ